MSLQFETECKVFGITRDPVTEFENKIAAFFGAPYAVAVDSCTHGVELCLRYLNADYMNSPSRTYLSIPMLASKLNIPLYWTNPPWVDYYVVYNNGRDFIYDAAVLWKANSYKLASYMCLSFQYQKHLSLGRGGMILCPNEESAIQLKKMSYDGRLKNIPWREQDIEDFGFHYYMTPETAQLGLDKLDTAIATPPRQWQTSDWPDISKFKVFNK
jgi:dTDP-4-amino-4,6-dideoxygalactose transaminase